ncbi:hypothetical protein GCM10020220_003960 [Nonomuraea rubra]
MVSLCVDDDQVHDKAMEIAVRLAAGAQEAIRLTKYSLNNWLRLAGPAFDASSPWSSSASPAPTWPRAYARCARSGPRPSADPAPRHRDPGATNASPGLG